MKWYLSIIDWREDDEELGLSGTVWDYDLVILTVRLWGYHFSFEWAFKPICNWTWQWRIETHKTTSISQYTRTCHYLPTLNFVVTIV